MPWRSGHRTRSAGVEEIEAAARELIQAPTWEATRAVLEEHPELLTDEADFLIGELIKVQTGPRTRRSLEHHRELLRRCRSAGVRKAFAEWVERDRAARSLGLDPMLPTELLAVVAELARPARPADIPRRIELSRRALRLVSREDDPVTWARLRVSLAIDLAQTPFTERERGLEEALAALPEAADLLSRHMQPQEWARAMGALGNVYSDRLRGDRAENQEKAIEAFQQALLVVRAADPVETGRLLHNLGTVLCVRIRGDRAENLEAAIRCWEEALESRTRERPREWAMTQSNLGHAWQERVRGDRAENLERAIRACEQALEVFTRRQWPLQWAAATMNLGNALRERLRGDRAENLERAIASYDQLFGVWTRETTPVEWARACLNLGVAWQWRERGDRVENIGRAVELYERALEVFTPDRMPQEWALGQMNLGVALATRLESGLPDPREIGKAISAYQRSLQVFTREAMPFEWARTQNNLGVAYSLRDLAGNQHGEQAVSCFEQALEVFGPEAYPSRCRSAARGLGHAFLLAGRWPEAAQAYRLAIRAAENLYGASLLLGSREVEIAASDGLYRYAGFSLARIGRPAEAAVLLERGRARGIGEALARDRADLERVRTADAAAHELFRSSAERLRRLDSAERSETTAFAGGTEARSREAEAAWGELREAVERIRRLPGYAGFLREPDLDGIAAAVRPGWPLAYLAVTPAGAVALLVHRRADGEDVAIETVWGDLKEGQVDELLAAGYLAGQLGATADMDAALGRVLPALGEALVGPLAERLRALGLTAVVLIPSGRLGLLPLHAARYRRDGRTIDLLDEVDVAYAPSARVLEEAHRSLAAVDGRPPSWLGVGNPLPHARPLAWARAEVETIAARFAATSRRCLLENDARKAALLATLPDATHLHLACHGHFDAAEPLDSRLDLAHGEGLSLREVLQLDLRRLRLVVLSACQTAVAEFERLPDEAIGLPAGFLQGGAPGVIGTLWPVDDRSTAVLMVKLYELLFAREQPLPPARALCAAQRWLRQATRQEIADLLGREAPAVAAARHLSPAVSPRSPSDERPFMRASAWAPFVHLGV